VAQYVTRASSGYDLSLTGPYRNNGVNMNVHVLNARLRPLWRTLNRYLNDFTDPLEWYLPIGDRVLVSCTDVREGMSGDPTLGSMHEVEVSFFILALYCNPLPVRIVSFAPYLFVNNAWAMVTGREIHGFRKELATSFAKIAVDDPAWQHRAADIEHVQAWAMRERGRGSRLEKMTLLEIKRPENPSASPDLGDFVGALLGSGIGELADQISDLLPKQLAFDKLMDYAERLLRKMVAGRTVEVPMVFLRQFRDPRRTQSTDVQQVLQATATGTIKAGPDFLAPSQLLLRHADSHPIDQELGLDADRWITSDLSFEVSLDFVLDDASRRD
jgi:hypothetical protein